MDLISITLSILLVITIFLMIRYEPKRARIRELLEKMPGPPANPIFGNAWELITSPIHYYDKIYTKRNMEYGPIFRTWRGSTGEVNINSAEAAEVILSSSEHIDKSEEYSTLQAWLGDCLFLKQGQKWKRLRKIFAPGFSTIVLDQYIDVFKNNSDILMKKIDFKADGDYFDICPFLAHCTLDIVCETTIGVKVDAQNGNNLSYFSALHDGLKMIVKRHTTLWLNLDFTFNRSKLGSKFRECVSVIHEFIGRIIHDRKAALRSTSEEDAIPNNKLFDSEVRRKNMDFIAIVGRKFTDEEVRETVDGMVFAGHDTTYVALSWAIQLLGEHLDVQEKVYEEMKRIFEGSDRAAEKQDLQEMKYLEQVIKETLRLYPSAPALGRQTRNDIQIGEYTIPAGASIWIQIYFIHRNPKYYPNPLEFNPDHFLPEKIKDRHPYAYLPFSAGPRSCLGQKYAMMEMKTMLSYIIRRYKIKSLRKTKDLSPVHSVTLTAHEGVYVSLTTREKHT